MMEQCKEKLNIAMFRELLCILPYRLHIRMME